MDGYMQQPAQLAQSETAPWPTSVHREETKAPTPFTGTYREKLILDHASELKATDQLYDDIDERDYTEYWYTLQSCRTDAWFAVSPSTRKVTVLSNACRLRWCPICSRSRANTISLSVQAWLRKISTPKLITLTLKHNDESLASQITRLYACFSSLRRRKLFADNCRGGVWFFQLKRSPESSEWHPHLHCAIDSDFIPWKAIKAAWLQITGDSDIIDIRRIWDPQKAADHVANYASRPAKLANYSREDRLEMYDTMKGKRLCGTWGTARTILLTSKSDGEFKDAVNIMSWSGAKALINSSLFAKAIWKAYNTGDPLPLSWALDPLESYYPPVHDNIEAQPEPPPRQTSFSDWSSPWD